MKLKRTQVLFTATQKQLINEYAEENEISFSEAVRRLVTDSIEKSRLKRKNPLLYLLERAEHAPSGAPSDLSTNDDYLYKDVVSENKILRNNHEINKPRK